VQGVALIVIEKAAAADKREIGEAAVDAAAAESELVGISQIDLAAASDARRAHRELPAIDASAFYGDGYENFGVIEIVMVEEIGGAGEEVVCVERPAAKRNGYPELVFFVALAVERRET